MPRYLSETRYTAAGAKGLAATGGSERVAMIEKFAASVGGKLEALYFAFGDVDLYCICDLPDNAAAAAMVLAINAGGAATTKTIVLLSPQEIDAAASKTVAYRPAGT